MNQDTLVQVNQLEPLDDLLDILDQSLVEEPQFQLKMVDYSKLVLICN